MELKDSLQSAMILQHAVTESERNKTIRRQLWRYKRLHMEYCYMALEGQSRSFLCTELIRGILVLSCKGPCPPARLDSLDPTTTQLSQKAQPEHFVWGRGDWDSGRLGLPWHNTFFASHFSGSPPTIMSIAHPPSQFPLSYRSQSLFFPFLLLASVSGAVPVAVTSLWVMRASLSTLCHILMSWDSNIFARVFFTLRAVRREAGLWAQHSDISFPICRRHWRHIHTYT